MQATTYRYIILNHLAPFIKNKYKNEDFYLIQDNDSKHDAYICHDILNKNNIPCVYYSIL